MRATKDAFEVLELIAAKRLARRLTTVLDTTGLDAKRRAGWLALAERHGVPAYAVVFETPAKVVRERNRARAAPLPPKVVSGQLRAVEQLAGQLADEGFAGRPSAGRGHARPTAVPHGAAGRRASGCRADGARVRPAAFALELPGSSGVHGSDACARSRRPPRRSAFRACGSWTTSCRSRRSGASGRTCSRATRRSATSRASRSGSGSARSSPASRIATSPTSRRSSRRWTCCRAAARSAASARHGSSVSTSSMAGGCRPAASATRCWRTRSSCCR